MYPEAKKANSREKLLMYKDFVETEGILLDDIGQSFHQTVNRFLKWLLIVFLIVTPVAIGFSVATERIPMCLLAYVNCLFIGYGLQWFLRKNILVALVPVLFILILLLSWPVAIIYFAIFHPDIYYGTMTGHVSHFEAGVRLQLCVLLFLIGYFSIMFCALRKDRPTETAEIVHPGRFANIAIFLGLAVLLLNSVSKVVRLPGFVTYLANGLFIYLNGIFFICGAMLKSIPKVIRILFFLCLGAAVFFYTIGNARGMALRPVFFLLLGILFFSRFNRKAKVILAICFVFAFPTYVVIANTTRVLLGTIGFEEGVSYRLKALKEWRAVKPEVSATSFALGRLFYTGGHSIIAQTPSRVPYRRFSPVAYPKEVLTALIPGRIYYRPYYRGPPILLDYGFMITEQTAVGLSMIGSFWFLGGYVPVLFGGVGLGLLHWLVIVILRRSWAVSKAKAFLYFSIFSPTIMWASRVSLINHWHSVVYRLVLAFIIYQVVRLIIGDYGPVMYGSESYSVLPEEEQGYG